MKTIAAAFRWLGLALLCVCLAACAALAPIPPTATPVPTLSFQPTLVSTGSSSPEMPRYAQPGPYSVALAKFALQSGEHTVMTYLWYPAQADGRPDKNGGPFPLVIFSPGGESKALDGIHNPHLASYGFTVLSWDPRDIMAYSDFWNYAFYRIPDMKLAIDHIGQMAAPGGELAGVVDTDHMAAIGYSLGSMNALMIGGAQLSFDWCTAHPELIKEDIEVTCDNFAGNQAGIAALLGLKSTPSGLWPAMSDPRVDAVITFASEGKMWGADYEGLSGLKAPVMLLVGELDEVIKPELGTYAIYQHLSSADKTQAVFANKDHNFFFAYGSDADPIDQLITAFLLAKVKGDKEAAKALLPENVNFEGVRYESTAAKD